MAEIVMPRLSDSMEEGTILRWLKHDGEEVARGEELVEIETDKANMTYESDQTGTLELLAAEGDTLPVGQPIARLHDGAVPSPNGAAAGAAGEPDGKPDEKPAEPPAAQPAGDRAPQPAPAPDAESAPAAEAAQQQRTVTAEQGGPTGAADAPDEGRVRASPLARRIASESGVDLHAVSPSGPGGRIVKADVLAAADGGTAQGASPTTSDRGATGGTAAGPEAQAAPGERPDVMTAKGETTTVELTRLQQAVARRMAEAKATIPDFHLSIDVDMEACVALRAQLKEIARGSASGESAHGEAPTYNDMVVKACALALREHPKANGTYRDGNLQLHSRVNIGVAVAAQDALVVPTVFDSDEKSLGEIARETHRLAGRVRDATITPPELGGGTFTVSNLGMFGVRSFTAIINPPQAAIMAVGALEQRAVVREGELVPRHELTLTLVCDHRILYGAEAAQLLARVRELLEAPAALTL